MAGTTNPIQHSLSWESDSRLDCRGITRTVSELMVRHPAHKDPPNIVYPEPVQLPLQ